MSVHTPSRALTRVNAPDQEKTLLLGYSIGSGETESGHSVGIVASGNTVRFHVKLADGRSADYDLDISPHASAAVELALVEA